MLLQLLTKLEGHNRVVTYPVVAKAVFNAFYMDNQSE